MFVIASERSERGNLYRLLRRFAPRNDSLEIIYGFGVALADSLGVTVGDASEVGTGVLAGGFVEIAFTLGLADGVEDGVIGPGVGV